MTGESYPQVDGGSGTQAPPSYSNAQYPQSQYPQVQYPQGQYPQYGMQPAYPPPDGSKQNTQYLQPGAYYSQQQSSNVVVTTMPGMVMAQPAVRETGPAPQTGCGLVLSILVLIFCGWPCGIGAIVANRRAKALVDMGQHTSARAQLKTMYVWIVVSIITGILGWALIGWRIKLAIDASKTTYYYRSNSYYG